MPGPDAKDRKHGRTPNTGANTGEWREYDDVPFEGAPPMPAPYGRKKAWHAMTVRWWQTVSKLPHAKDWRDDDWVKVEMLMDEIESYYTTDRADRKTTQFTEIRRREDSLGIGSSGRLAQKIRYKPVPEPGTGEAADGPAKVVVDDSPGTPAGNVVTLAARRQAITQNTATG